MADQSEMTFEEALEALEAAVARLEAGGLTLEESLAVYEQARALAAFCEEQLEAAELRVLRLTESGDVEEM